MSYCFGGGEVGQEWRHAVLLLLKVSVSSGVFFLSIPNFVISTSK